MKKLLYPILLLSVILTACQESREQQFVRSAQELTQRCPMVINECTVMDSVSYEPATTTYTYYYTVSGPESEILQAIQQTAAQMGDNIRNSVELKPQKEAGVTFRYVYHAPVTGKTLGDVTVRPSDYR
jgi:hypothetical protein